MSVPLRAALAAALTAFLAILIAGAIGARTDLRLSEPDLEVVRNWSAQGEVESFATRPGHLAKPGYLVLLKFAMPDGSPTEAELLRWRIFQALFVWAGAAAVCLALWKRGRPKAALGVASMLLLCLPLRDACDYVMSEGTAIGFSLLFCAALLTLPPSKPRFWTIPGLGAAALILLRPNIAYSLLLVALVVLIGAGPPRLPRTVSLLMGFAVGLLLLRVAGSVARIPLASDASQALFFGTTEYGWPHDLVPWPSGATPEETARRTLGETRTRWNAFWKQEASDRSRSLVWKATHSILSREDLPSLWDWPVYRTADKAVRNGWWLLMLAAASAAAVCLAGGSGPWRAVPAAVLAIAVAQGVAAGAVSRYFLPLVPVLIVGLCSSARRIEGLGTIAAAAFVFVLLAAAIRAAPDAAASDFSAAREPGVSFATRLPPESLPPGEALTVHLRMLLTPGRGLGFEVEANGRPVHRHEPDDETPSPAYLTIPLAGEPLREARARGLEIEVRSLGAPSDRYLYFPVVPPPLSRKATRDGQTRLPSVFGDSVRGGIPVWVHAGADPPRHDPVAPR